MEERGKGDLKRVEKRMKEIREETQINRAVSGVPDQSAQKSDRSAHLKWCPLGSRENQIDPQPGRIDPVLAVSIPDPHAKTGSIRERTGSIRFWQ